jgi:cytochrome c
VRSPLSLLAGACLALFAVSACTPHEPAPPKVAGDARLGARLIEQYHCGSCHVIPDIPAAQGRTGPMLEQFGRRSFIAGSIPNFPDALARWIVDPAAMKPGTTMPSMGVSESDARHMAAYLASLR